MDTENYEIPKIEELSNEVVEQSEKVEPLEMLENAIDDAKEMQNDDAPLAKYCCGDGCMCSVRMSCTVGY